MATSGMGDTIDVPELSDIDYFNDVLRLPTHKFETHIDDEVDARAIALGIPVSQLAKSDKRNTSSAESASTVATTHHTRTFSTASHDSACTALTAHSSIYNPPSEKVPPDAKSSTRSWANSLKFTQYDKYLLRLSPKLDQTKLLRPSTPPEHTGAQSLFSVKTKKSFLSVKSGLKKRMRWARKTTESTDLPV